MSTKSLFNVGLMLGLSASAGLAANVSVATYRGECQRSDETSPTYYVLCLVKDQQNVSVRYLPGKETTCPTFSSGYLALQAEGEGFVFRGHKDGFDIPRAGSASDTEDRLVQLMPVDEGTASWALHSEYHFFSPGYSVPGFSTIDPHQHGSAPGYTVPDYHEDLSMDCQFH